MLQVLEVLFPVPYQDRSIEFGIAPDIIVVAGIEQLAGAVEPGFLWSEEALVKDGVRIAGFRTVGKLLASFENQDAKPRFREAIGHRGASDTGADDDDVR
jgi:hypothetical protein